MFDLAFQFRRNFAQITHNENNPNGPVPLCRCKQKVKLLFVKKSGPNKGRPFFSCSKPREQGCGFFEWADRSSSTSKSGGKFFAPTYSSMVQSVENITDQQQRQYHFRKNGIPYYVDCELIRSLPNSPPKHKYRRRVSREEDGNDDDMDSYENGYRSAGGRAQWFLKLGEKERSTTAYSKDDVWIISTSEDFNPRDGDGSVIIGKSLSHGPTSNDLVPIGIISGRPKSIATQEVYAIRGPNFSTEFEIINNLQNLEKANLPLLYELLGQSSLEYCKPPTSTDDEVDFKLLLPVERIDLTAEKFISEYELNSDQKRVIEHCCKWFKGEVDVSSILLVHGVFGAGKSYLLVVLIMFICSLLEEAGDSDIKILVSSVTNVAVDNILCGLQRKGFHEFLRVGSQRKIAKTILPYTVSTDKNNREMIKELRSMIRDPTADKEELEAMKQQLEDLKSGAAENRKQQIKDVRVVGVTCAATAFEVLQGCRFPIIILDESSQCLEPLALLPISRFSCQKLIAVGDPLQLPPTILGNANNRDSFTDSIEKTLFIRMTRTGLKPVLLRTQYRCHPRISELSNKLFYSERLIDGVLERERTPLVKQMPPVALIDCLGKEERAEGSWYNDSEVRVIVHLCKILFMADVPPEQMGVVTMFRTQRTRLQNALIKENLKSVKVSTVDAFQGGEKEIIFISTVKASGDLSFIESNERLNVAITRARRHLIIVGKRLFLSKSRTWKFVIDQAASLKGIYSAAKVINCSDFSFLYDSEVKTDVVPIPPNIKNMPLSEYMSELMSSDSLQHNKKPRHRARVVITDDSDDEEDQCESVRIDDITTTTEIQPRISDIDETGTSLDLDVEFEEIMIKRARHEEEDTESDEQEYQFETDGNHAGAIQLPSKKKMKQTPVEDSLIDEELLMDIEHFETERHESRHPLLNEDHFIDTCSNDDAVESNLDLTSRSTEGVTPTSWADQMEGIQQSAHIDSMFGLDNPLQLEPAEGMFDLEKAIKEHEADMEEFGW